MRLSDLLMRGKALCKLTFSASFDFDRHLLSLVDSNWLLCLISWEQSDHLLAINFVRCFNSITLERYHRL